MGLRPRLLTYFRSSEARGGALIAKEHLINFVVRLDPGCPTHCLAGTDGCG